MEELQSTNEELETTNEELQSTIEELETTNEELQSTNEELETMNEELQSTNEELETMNDELRTRTTELNHVNAFMESILISLHGAVVVVDTEMRVMIWSVDAENLWGLRPEEVNGDLFFDLEIGLPVEQLREPIQECINGESQYEVRRLQARNRRGQDFECKVTCTPLLTVTGSIDGAILLMEDHIEGSNNH